MHNSHAHVLPTPHYTHIHIHTHTHTHTLTTNYMQTEFLAHAVMAEPLLPPPSDQHAANSWDSTFHTKCQHFQHCEYTPHHYIMLQKDM